MEDVFTKWCIVLILNQLKNYKIFTHLQLCLSTVPDNGKIGENYSHLFNLRPNIYESAC